MIQSDAIIRAPLIFVQKGLYKRVADAGYIIGNEALKFGGKPTSWVEVYTDVKGNIITAYPIPRPF